MYTTLRRGIKVEHKLPGFLSENKPGCAKELSLIDFCSGSNPANRILVLLKGPRKSTNDINSS